MKRDNTILIGFMGCGKTSVGIRLSYRQKCTLIDTDKWIEQKYKMTVADIFSTHGEAAFRKMETQCLEELLQNAEQHIISVGGGLPMTVENRPLLKALGEVIYLKVTPEAVYERLKGDVTRPLLQVEHPEQKIRQLMEQRDPVYTVCADRMLEVSNKSFEEILQEICSSQEVADENTGHKRS